MSYIILYSTETCFSFPKIHSLKYTNMMGSETAVSNNIKCSCRRDIKISFSLRTQFMFQEKQ